MNFIEGIKAKFDSFKNRITGYGTERDHGVQTKWELNGQKLSKAVLDDFYATHELAWKIIDTGPTYGLRNWISFPKVEDEGQKAKINQIIKDSGFRPALKRALKLNACYGALLYVILDDGMEQDKPVEFDRIRAIKSVEVIERGYISPKYIGRSLRHEVYRIDQDNLDPVYVHKSRLIRIPGAEASSDWLLMNDGWPPSKLERAFEPLKDLSSAYGLLPNIVKDIIRDVVKLQGLNELSINDCAEDQKAFNDRMDAMFLAQSLINKLVLDKEDEYQRQTTNITGVSDVIRLLERRVVAVSGQPHSYLLGESPGGGIGQGKGESQDRDLNKYVECYQEDEIRQPIEQFLNFVEPLVNEPELEFVFNPVSSQTSEQQAYILEKVANAAEKLTGKKAVLTQSEAATFFEGNQIRLIPTLDLESREKYKSLNQEQIEYLLKPTEPQETPTNGSEESDPESGRATPGTSPDPGDESGDDDPA